MNEIAHKKELILIAALTLLALALRVWRLDGVPPGWRVDELSNALVVSQHVLDGDIRFFYPDASGHEGLFHWLQAIFIRIFGQTAAGFRGLSVVFGTLTVPLTYVVGKRLFSWQLGLIAALGLCVSFWSLMYSRVGIRHVTMPVFWLLCVYFFWRACATPSQKSRFLAAGLMLGIGAYTYFASWVGPATIFTFIIYCLVFNRTWLRPRLVGMALALGVGLILALPLFNAIRNLPETDEAGRVSEVAAPVTAAREGDFSLIGEHFIDTLLMFSRTGDSEWLYNIPFRPIFSLPLALLFFVGVGMLVFKMLRGEPRYAFVLIWLLGGLGPSIVSVPAGSLGHTIAAQSPVFMTLALPLAKLLSLDRWRQAGLVLTVVVLISVGARDLPDYFSEWARSGNTRFLYNADIHDIGIFVDERTDLADVGVTGLLAGQWERLALDVSMPPTTQARLFDPQRAILLEMNGQPANNFRGYPVLDEVYLDLYGNESERVSGYLLETIRPIQFPNDNLGCWENGLCLVSAEYNTPLLDITFRVQSPLALPEIKTVSFPPVPGDYQGPRLSVFAHLWNDNGDRLTGDDGFWVDPLTLRQGDVFRQRHILIPPDGTATTIAIGLYDPLTNMRINTTNSADHIAISLP